MVCLWIADSGFSRHMTGNRSYLTNFVDKFCGTVKFGNDHIAPILGYGDIVRNGITIKRVAYVEGLGHNLFSVGQFCDNNFQVLFRRHVVKFRRKMELMFLPVQEMIICLLLISILFLRHHQTFVFFQKHRHNNLGYGIVVFLILIFKQ